MIGNGNIFTALKTFFNALRITTIQEEAFVNGQAFSYEDYLTYSNGGINDFIFDPTAFSGTNLVVTPPQFSSTAGPVTIEYFAGATADDDGTLLGISNRRGTSGNTNEAILRLNPSNIVDGVRFSGRLIPATGLNPATSNGSSGGSNLPFELDTSVKYLIRVTNNDGAGVLIQADFTWLEI